MEAYTLSFVGVLALCLLSILLAIYSGSSKGRAGAVQWSRPTTATCSTASTVCT